MPKPFGGALEGGSRSMPLWKFRTLEEMNASTAGPGGDSAARFESLITMMNSAVPSLYRRGVQKFRTMEEANEERLQRDIERARSLKEDAAG